MKHLRVSLDFDFINVAVDAHEDGTTSVRITPMPFIEATLDDEQWKEFLFTTHKARKFARRAMAEMLEEVRR